MENFWSEVTTDENVEIHLERNSFDIEKNHVKEKKIEVDVAFEEINSPVKVDIAYKISK